MPGEISGRGKKLVRRNIWQGEIACQDKYLTGKIACQEKYLTGEIAYQEKYLAGVKSLQGEISDRGK